MFLSDAEQMTQIWLPSGTVAQWLQQHDLGSHRWWEQLHTAGTPVIEHEAEGETRMHFFWRDPEGRSELSATKKSISI
ncbi:hypothetical protein [Pantoea rodasii]|uniref:hypothetical protein n=1 Tax=Pantoea rodasii TaxID=1076549 RepID=UPI0034551935